MAQPKGWQWLPRTRCRAMWHHPQRFGGNSVPCRETSSTAQPIEGLKGIFGAATCLPGRLWRQKWKQLGTGDEGEAARLQTAFVVTSPILVRVFSGRYHNNEKRPQKESTTNETTQSRCYLMSKIFRNDVSFHLLWVARPSFRTVVNLHLAGSWATEWVFEGKPSW